MTAYPFNLDRVDSSWKECLLKGLANMDASYLKQLSQSNDWLPGTDKIFSAFSLPLNQVNHVLFGESPYPRSESANGYAFWDAAVKELWSPSGLSKKVNRATSLRNILKMLFIAEGLLNKNQISQADIAKVDKHSLIQTNDELFANFLDRGILLLNATLVLQSGAPHKDARYWLPFIQEILSGLLDKRPQSSFILLGRIANTINPLISHAHIKKRYAEHPYNISFITNDAILDFFNPLHLLKRIS